MEVSKNNRNLNLETGLRTTLALIPYIGGALVELGFEHRARIKSDRIYNFFEELDAYFKSIKDDEVDNDFINSNRFNDIFEEIINKVSKTDDLKKRNRFKQLLIGTTIPNAKVNQFELFFELTSQLHESQILLLKKFYKAKPVIEKLENQGHELNDELNQSKSKENILKQKAQDGSIKQNESILAQTKKSEKIEREKILTENKMKDLMSVSRNDLFGVSDIDMNIFVDDLLSKRLILDISEVQMGGKSYSYDKLIISPLGYHYIDFLIEENKSSIQ
ncbi:hypothetical protein CW751_14440 [Brumimicrobium salinarum]|uniref:DUF4393 domain-containing protein n=1 Tax=Brumimicrobium salinarum TaxID=2058658 RepID=A0A2I0QYX6_9FLAO|nr:hypothetical protein [Brumimicrobium salinarum]PKR79545.1 hypothetical protein CW751_14440 [Brumimicrobium salinarum]